MRLSRSRLSVFATALVISTGVYAGEEKPCVTPITPEPNRIATGAQELKFNGRSEKVAIHHGYGGSVVRGFNVLDKPVTFHCKDASGCLLSVLSSWGIDTPGPAYMCTFVDGNLIRQKYAQNMFPLMEAKRLTTGNHVLQTQIYSLNPGTLSAWQINYTMYDEPNRP